MPVPVISNAPVAEEARGLSLNSGKGGCAPKLACPKAQWRVL